MTPNHWPVTYFEGNQELWRNEESSVEVAIGEGVILPLPGVKRYRVVDIWHSYDNHGHVDIGTNVYLEEISGTDDDLPQELHPTYFR